MNENYELINFGQASELTQGSGGHTEDSGTVQQAPAAPAI
jgi:hypothetical protein